MIEFCTKRRMIVSIIFLGLLTILVLILEEALTSEIGTNGVHIENSTKRSSPVVPLINANPSSNGVKDLPEDKKAVCWMYEKFKIIKDCSFCTDFEIQSKTPLACTETGFKETIRCETSGTVHRSCPRNRGLEMRRFWIFESLMLLTVVISYGMVKIRWSQLERRTVKAIERRLAAGH